MDLFSSADDLCFFFSEFVTILERLMRSTLKVDEVPLQLILLQEFGRSPLCLDLDSMQLPISHVVCAPIAEGNFRARSSFFIRILGMQTASDRRQREISCNYRIKKQERQLSKERTIRQTKNFIDCKITHYAEILKLKSSAAILSILCGESEKPTNVEGGQLLQRVSARSRSGLSREIHFSTKKEGAGIGVTVPSTNNPQILVWLNACTKEVQNCRQIATIGTEF